VRRAPFHLSAVLVILTGLTACDNVSWGGIDLRMEAPPTPEGEAELEEGEEESEPEPEETGPLLFFVERDDSVFEAVPVAEMDTSGLRALPGGGGGEGDRRRIGEEALREGRRLILFARGARVGSFVLGDARGIDPTSCFQRPRIGGHAELVPGAVEHQRFLAVPEELGRGVAYQPFRLPSSTRAQRAAALGVAASILERLGVAPPSSLVISRVDLQILALDGTGEPAITATHLNRDRLRIEPAPDPAWSLFFVAEVGEGGRYESTFSLFRSVEEDGKGVTRLLDHLDWDRDGAPELFLEILGAEHRSFAALTRDGFGWRMVLDEECPEPDEEAGRVAAPR